MRFSWLVVLALAACAPAPVRAPATFAAGEAPAADRTDAPKLVPYRIILVGDSTMAPNSGWGGAFCAFHVKWKIACLNLARGARSTRSFRQEGGWDLALAEMRVPGYEKTYVLIQMGHNDAARNKPERWTELATEYPDNLRRFVREAREAGAVPVLVTPLARRDFADGLLVNALAPWSEQVRTVARELDVPLIDLNRRSAVLLQQVGPVASMEYAQLAPTDEEKAAGDRGTTLPPPAAPSNPEDNKAREDKQEGARGQLTKKFDYTHLGENGARVFSSMVADDLATVAPELAALLLP